MERSEFLEELRNLLDDPSLTEDQRIAPKTWDSVEIMLVITLVDRAGKRVQVADILRCQVASELVDLAVVQ